MTATDDGLLRELHLHIGLPKTGTTAIQAGLLANRERLAEAGLHLAPMHDELGQHHPLARLLRKDGVDAFLRALGRAPGRRKVASSELFVDLLRERPWLLEELRARFDGTVRLHLSLRRWDAYNESLYAQLWRNHVLGLSPKPSSTIDSALRPDGPLPSLRVNAMASMVERAAEVFGPGAVVLSAYPETGPRNAFRRFLETALPGVDPGRWAEEPTRNRSIPRRSTLLIGRFGGGPATFGPHLLRRVQRSEAIEDDGIRPLLPPDGRAKMVAEAADSYARMARVGGLPEAELAALTAPLPPEPDWRPPAPIAPAEIRRFVAEGWRRSALLAEGRRRLPARAVRELWIAWRLLRRRRGAAP